VEKYAVDEQGKRAENEKQSAAGCPECGQPLEKHGAVVKCPTHGTEPFEANRNPWHPPRE